jgi:hypothetical protein
MDRTERARVLGGALKQKKNLSLRQTNFIIDPFQASLGCLLVVSFPKSNSKYYAFALSMAEGQSDMALPLLVESQCTSLCLE